MTDPSGLPLWLLTAAFLLALLAAREVGALIRCRWSPQANEPGDASASDGFAMTAVLGLLALLIGFTFSIALGRFDERRGLVVQEANALGTTWLRADLLEDADRARLRDVLRRYVDARIDFANARGSDEEVQQYARSSALQRELWSVLMDGTLAFRDTPRASLLITTANASIDLADERFAARQDHIPRRIIRTLLLFALLAAGLVGYERPRHRRSGALLLVLFALAAGLVLDLDQPTTGATHVPQEPMTDLEQRIKAEVSP